MLCKKSNDTGNEAREEENKEELEYANCHF
jgi:hypothetical protein